MISRSPLTNYQSMSLVHRSEEGSELWLGDYYAATNLQLLKQKNIRAGTAAATQCSPRPRCWEWPTPRTTPSRTRSSTPTTPPATG